MLGKLGMSSGFLLLWVLLASPKALEAAWTVSEIARNAGNSRFEGDYVAYDRADDILLYRISTADHFAVTHDGSASVDEILGMEDNWLWFSSLDTRNGSCRLRLYDRITGRIHDLMEGEHPMVWGSAEGGVAVIRADGDWWLCSAESLQRVTWNETTIVKYEAVRSGDFLFWTGSSSETGGHRWVFRSYIPLPLTVPLARDDRDRHSLCGSGDHVVWMEYPSSSQNLREVYHYRTSSGEKRLVGTSQELAWADFLDMEYPSLIWIQKDGSRWKLIRYDLESGLNMTLQVSNLRMLEPVIHGNRILYVTENCPDRTCAELNVHDLASRTWSRLTTMGNTHDVWASEPDQDRIVWSDHSALTGDKVLTAVGGP